MVISARTRPLVSAIMPTYNRGRFVRHAVEQVLAQAWPNMEVVIMDDSEPFEKLQLGPKVKHVRLDRRTTVGEKHNLAFDVAQGSFFAHWDDDDIFGPRRILAQMEPLLTSPATVSGFGLGYVLHAATGKFFRLSYRRLKVMQRPQIQQKLARFRFHDGTAVFSREVLRHGVRYPDVTIGQKLDFLNDLIQAGEEMSTVENRRHFVYVRHGRNTWQFVEGKVLIPVASPRWFPKSELDFMREAAA